MRRDHPLLEDDRMAFIGNRRKGWASRSSITRWRSPKSFGTPVPQWIGGYYERPFSVPMNVADLVQVVPEAFHLTGLEELPSQG
jgi:hypothetical protein